MRDAFRAKHPLIVFDPSAEPRGTIIGHDLPADRMPAAAPEVTDE
jgi:hypothetical protein